MVEFDRARSGAVGRDGAWSERRVSRATQPGSEGGRICEVLSRSRRGRSARRLGGPRHGSRRSGLSGRRRPPEGRKVAEAELAEAMSPRGSCFVCDKHRGEVDVPGGALYEDDLVYVSHGKLSEETGRGYPGVLFIEPKRHVDGLAELTDAEAERSASSRSGRPVHGPRLYRGGRSSRSAFPHVGRSPLRRCAEGCVGRRLDPAPGVAASLCEGARAPVPPDPRPAPAGDGSLMVPSGRAWSPGGCPLSTAAR